MFGLGFNGREMTASSLSLFGNFIGACSYMIQKPTAEHLRAGIATEEMDFPLFRYGLSLEGRISMADFSYQHIKETNEGAIEEIVQSKKKKVGEPLPSHNQFALISYFESFIDQVHKTLETIATMNLFIYPIQWNELSNNDWRNISSFNYQRKRIINGELSFGTEYEHVMAEMDWFDELRDIRDNANHSMSGLPVHGTDNDMHPILVYYVHICLGRLDARVGVKQFPIIEKTELFYRGFHSSLDKIGQCYLQTIDREKKIPIPVFKDGKVSFTELNFNEFIKGNNSAN